MSTHEILKARYELVAQTINSIEQKLAGFPEGSIVLKHRKQSALYFYAEKNSKAKYLGKKDSKQIAVMVQKRYLQKVLKTAKQEAKILKQILSYYPLSTLETVYDDLPEEVKRYARPIVVGDEQFAAKWLEKPYKKKPFKKDAPEFYTLKHERVRSKSEIIIADRLNANGIPYKYECPLIVGGRIIHPDFTILRMSDRKILYHEHCGKLGDPAYVKDMIERSNAYTHNGIFIGDSLFYTFESEDATLDVKALDELINKNYR